METEILHLVEGAKKATGVTIIIDVFRAFSLEATAFEKGCEKGVLTGTVEEAFAIKKEHPDWLLFGERDGRKVEGFDYGNAPSAIENRDLSHKTFIHTTTNGVQGIMNAVHATDILTGSFLNGEATVRYIKKLNPEHVSIVAMGWKDGRTEEDELCAEYLSSLLHNSEMPDIDERIENLKYQEGKKFFVKENQDVFPEADFYICTKKNICDFAIKVEKEGSVYVSKPVR